MKKNPKILLQDMLFSIEKIGSFVKDVSKEDFLHGIMIQDAVIRRFAVIGEAANKIPEDVKEKHKEVQWKEIVTMRNFLLHEYFDIDLGIVWDTIKRDLPKLKAELSRIMEKM